MIQEWGRPDRPLVLIVDDEPQILQSLGDLLRREFRVIATDTPSLALDILDREPVALVLCDQRMPKMVGADLLSEAVHLRPDTVRVLMTGYADIEAVIQAVNKGRVYHYVLKPWDPDALLALVRETTRYQQLIVEQQVLLRRLEASHSERTREPEMPSALTDRIERLQADNDWLSRSIDQLRRSSDALQRIGEVLPICMECGKVKNASAAWEDVPKFLAESGVALSHGYCPACVALVEQRYP
jgi:response regulator RpfG family c-di-GMP phosphodiesterase